MNDNDRIKFAGLMTELGEVFSHAISDVKAEVYFRTLNDLPIQDFEAAVYLAIANCKFFPKPVELREMLEGSADDRANQAWELACEANHRTGGYQSVYFEDGAIGASVVTVFHSWVDTAESLSHLSPEMIASKRKEFFATYRNAQRGHRSLHYLPGHFEVENKNTVATWKRGTYDDCYPMKVLMVMRAGMYFVEVLFDRATAELIGGVQQLLKEQAVKYLPPVERKLLTEGESERQYYDVEGEIKRLTSQYMIPKERPVMSDEDLESRRAVLREQLEKLKGEQPNE